VSTAQRNAPASAQRPRLVFYGSLSKASDDPHQESIESQIARVRTKADAEYPDGYVLLGDPAATTDDGYSGSKRDRGPGLERAIALAVAAADDGGGAPVEIWVNTPARFARGTGRKNQARSIMELFVHMQREGVTLRAVNDDDMVRREELVGFASRMAAKYSEDLGESVSRAKLRQLEAGEHLGGPMSDGYRTIYHHDDAQGGRIVGRTTELDPKRGPIWRDIFDLAEQGISDAEIARRMNAKGHRTRNGCLFDSRAIRNGVTNPWYAGRIAHKRNTPDMTVHPGKHPALVDPAVFDAIQAGRKLRDVAPGSDKGGGRPPERHALARLAVCGVCGEPMHARTSTHVRKDGTQRRTYICRSALLRTGACDAPRIDAEIVDAAVIEGLGGLLVNFEAWQERITSGHVAERDRLTREVERAERDRDAQARRTERVEAKWSTYVASGDDEKADLVLAMVERERDALAQADRRLTAARDALASVPTEAPMDAMLDFTNALREAVRGRVDAQGSMAHVNQALRELFIAFELEPSPWVGIRDGRIVYDGGPAVRIQPYLSWETAERLLRAGRMPAGHNRDWPKFVPLGDNDGDAPPLRWLRPNTNSPTPADDPEHESWSAGDGATLTETCATPCVLARHADPALR